MSDPALPFGLFVDVPGPADVHRFREIHSEAMLQWLGDKYVPTGMLQVNILAFVGCGRAWCMLAYVAPQPFILYHRTRLCKHVPSPWCVWICGVFDCVIKSI